MFKETVSSVGVGVLIALVIMAIAALASAGASVLKPNSEAIIQELADGRTVICVTYGDSIDCDWGNICAGR